MTWPLRTQTINEGGVLIHTALAQDAGLLAAYNASHAAHLKPWDVGWSQARTDPTAFAARLPNPPCSSNSPLGEGQGALPSCAPPGLHTWIGWAERVRGDQDTANSTKPSGSTADAVVELEQLTRSPLCSRLTLRLSYSCAPTIEGSGLMTRVLSAVIRELAHGSPAAPYNLLELQALVRSDNIRSNRVLLRLGFSDTGPDLDFPAIPVSGIWRRHHRWTMHLRLSAI